MKETILGFNVLNTDYDNLINNIFTDMNNNKQNFLVNINPMIILNFYKNKKYIKIFNDEKYQIPDGVGIVFASKFRKNIIKNRITGIDLMEKICEESAKQSKTIFLCGAKPNVAAKTQKKLENKYKKIKIVGCCDGYIKENEMIEKIKKSNPDIVFVALGSPKQEEFILNNRNILKNVKLFMPVGGSFDVISGNIKRSPEFYQNMHIEWLYRMIKEPRRIKQNILLIKFIFLVLLTKK